MCFFMALHNALHTWWDNSSTAKCQSLLICVKFFYLIFNMPVGLYWSLHSWKRDNLMRAIQLVSPYDTMDASLFVLL